MLVKVSERWAVGKLPAVDEISIAHLQLDKAGCNERNSGKWRFSDFTAGALFVEQQLDYAGRIVPFSMRYAGNIAIF
jgi:hypothetical protein